LPWRATLSIDITANAAAKTAQKTTLLQWVELHSNEKGTMTRIPKAHGTSPEGEGTLKKGLRCER
jgi:hypothetical protein